MHGRYVRENIKTDLKGFKRKAKIHGAFLNKEKEDISIHRNKSNTETYARNQEINNICNLKNFYSYQVHTEDNLTPEERIALRQLTSNGDLIIKKQIIRSL